MTKMRHVVLFIVAASILTGCGTRTSDRVLSGAGIGAGAGALGSAVVGGDVLGGAVIGGVAGGAIGGLTSPRQINLGRPIWRKKGTYVKRKRYNKRPYARPISPMPRNEIRYD